MSTRQPCRAPWLRQKEAPTDPKNPAPGSFQLRTWGVSADLKRATNLEDPRDLGAMSAARLVRTLRHIQQLQPITEAGEDMSEPPRAEVIGPAGSFHLYADGGQVYCPDTDRHLDAAEVPEMVQGPPAGADRTAGTAQKPSGAVGCLRLALAVPIALALGFLSIAGGVGIIRKSDEQIIQVLGFFVIFWGLVLTRAIYRLIRGSDDQAAGPK